MERDEAGDVGDLRVAGEISLPAIAPDPLLCVLVDCAFRCFRCRTLSSLWSLILIERLAGAISSEACSDFERVCRAEADNDDCSVSLMDRSRSDSDSEDRPDEEEFDEKPFLPLTDVRLPEVLPRF